MYVVDVFYFQDGRTVLMGTVAGHEKFIGPCRCEMLIGDKRVAVIELEVEMLTDPPHKEYRSVSTRDVLALDKEMVAKRWVHLARTVGYSHDPPAPATASEHAAHRLAAGGGVGMVECA